MKTLRTLLAAVAVAAGLAISAPAAFAADPVIEAAIDAGTVGERIDGYLGVVGDADAATTRKVNEINNRRRAKYEQVAADTGTTAAQVGRVTGEQQIAKLQAGEYYMDESATWKRK